LQLVKQRQQRLTLLRTALAAAAAAARYIAIAAAVVAVAQQLPAAQCTVLVPWPCGVPSCSATQHLFTLIAQ
jgi:hypothetical protein